MVGGVQRLVNVAYEVHDPLQRLVSRPRPGVRVAQYLDLTRELCRSAAAAAADLGVVPRPAQRNVVIVPGAAAFSPFEILDLVGPVRDFSKGASAGRLAAGETITLEQL